MNQLQPSKFSENDLQQALRIASGTALGFVLCKLLDWPMGIFFTVFPVLLLGLVPVLNAHIIRQFIASGIFSSLGILLLWSIFSAHPVLLTMMVFGVFVWLFSEMSKGVNFMFGALCLVNFSVELHFASYGASGNVIYPMVTANLLAVFVTIFVGMLMHWIFPDVSPRETPLRPGKDAASVRHEVLLCASVATLSFIIFQVFDLRDSVSAQAASVLILFPLCWKGAGMAGWMRVVGTLIGCSLALLCQFVLYSHSDLLLFSGFFLWLMTFIFSRYHVMGGGMPGIAFGIITTFGILFGQSLGPDQDLLFSALYRVSSVTVAILISLGAVYLLHKWLNRYGVTRHHTYD